jgi:hypothetical protein
MVMVFRQILREIRHAANDIPQAVGQGSPPDAFHANFGAFGQRRRLVQHHDPILDMSSKRHVQFPPSRALLSSIIFPRIRFSCQIKPTGARSARSRDASKILQRSLGRLLHDGSCGGAFHDLDFIGRQAVKFIDQRVDSAAQTDAFVLAGCFPGGSPKRRSSAMIRSKALASGRAWLHYPAS